MLPHGGIEAQEIQGTRPRCAVPLCVSSNLNLGSTATLHRTLLPDSCTASQSLIFQSKARKGTRAAVIFQEKSATQDNQRLVRQTANRQRHTQFATSTCPSSRAIKAFPKAYTQPTSGSRHRNNIRSLRYQLAYLLTRLTLTSDAIPTHAAISWLPAAQVSA